MIKKTHQRLISIVSILGMLLIPSVAMAQDVPTVEVETTTPTTTTQTAPTTTAGVPETGIAPKPSNLIRNSAVFVVGGTVGAAIGLAIVTIKRQKSTADK